MSDQQSDASRLEVNLQWPLEDGLQAVYANQFAVFGNGPEYVIMFGEFLPSGLFANRPKQEIEEYLKNAKVKPLAKVVLSPAGLETFYGLLKNYMEQKQVSEQRG